MQGVQTAAQTDRDAFFLPLHQLNSVRLLNHTELHLTAVTLVQRGQIITFGDVNQTVCVLSTNMLLGY